MALATHTNAVAKKVHLEGMLIAHKGKYAELAILVQCGLKEEQKQSAPPTQIATFKVWMQNMSKHLNCYFDIPPEMGRHEKATVSILAEPGTSFRGKIEVVYEQEPLAPRQPFAAKEFL